MENIRIIRENQIQVCRVADTYARKILLRGQAPIRRYRAVVMTCGSPNSSLASLCFHKHNPYLVSLSFYTIPICTLFLIRSIFNFLIIGIGMVPSIIDEWSYDGEFCSSSPSPSLSSDSTTITQKRNNIK